jgi:hypothetical protein
MFAQKAKQLANPSIKERAVAIRNQIIERQTRSQLRNSSEGVQLVKKSVAFMFDRFEQLLREQVQDSLPIQTQRYETPTHAFPWPCIIAEGPLNANVEFGYANRDDDSITRDRLFVSMFHWDRSFASVQGRRNERQNFSLIPDITADREVQWRNEQTEEPYFPSEQIVQETVEHFLAFITVCNEEAS